MNTKVLLIYPPSQLVNREDRCQVPTKDVVVAPALPPTDLMYMASMAESEGCISKIIDYTLDNASLDELVSDLKEFKPDYLVISVTTPTLEEDLQSCSVAKKTLPAIKIIAKGAHFLTYNIDVLRHFPDLDIIIRGEPEVTLKEIVSGKNLFGISGISWRSPAGIVNNPDRPFLENLDSLPFPARHLIDNKRYVRPDNGRTFGVIKVARGCPYDCFFCLATPVSGSRVRMRSPDNIISEIRLSIEKYKIRDFLFWSDIFDADRKWVIELCDSILRSRLKFTWATNTRADTIDLEMACLMRKSGCVLVSVGVESGNQTILDNMGKRLTLDKIRESFQIFKKAGLVTFAYYIIGLPWDTMETIEDTINFAIELDSDFANFFTATAFPGTRFFEYALENKLFDEEWRYGNNLYKDAYYYPTVRGHYLNKDDLAGFHKEAVRRFFLRPGYILKRLSRIRSFRELYNYSKIALSILKHR